MMFTQQQIEEITEEDVRQMVMDDIFEEELYYGYVEEFPQHFEDEEYEEYEEDEDEEDEEDEDNIMTYLTNHQYNHRTFDVVVDDEETLRFDENELKEIDCTVFVDDKPTYSQFNQFSDLFIDTMSYFDGLSYHMTDNIIINDGHMSAVMLIILGIRSRNYDIFTELTEFMDNKQKKENFNKIEEELVSTAFKPERMEKLINNYGFDGMLECFD